MEAPSCILQSKLVTGSVPLRLSRYRIEKGTNSSGQSRNTKMGWFGRGKVFSGQNGLNELQLIGKDAKGYSLLEKFQSPRIWRAWWEVGVWVSDRDTTTKRIFYAQERYTNPNICPLI
jgi:hypothetical protein